MQIKGNLTKKEGFQFISEIKLHANNSGFVKCKAINMNGSDEAVSGFYVSGKNNDNIVSMISINSKSFYLEVDNGFDIFDFDNTVILDEGKTSVIVALGEPFTMTCAASLHNYTDITWLYNGEMIANTDSKYFIVAH